MQNNAEQKMALVNSTKHTQKKPRLRERTDRACIEEAFYDIRPGKGVGLFFQPGAHKAPGCQVPEPTWGCDVWSFLVLAHYD